LAASREVVLLDRLEGAVRRDSKKSFRLLILLPSLVVLLGFFEEARTDTVRQAAVSGSFYPEKRSELQKLVSDYLGSVESSAPQGRVFGLIAPHAGYVYSAQVAAHAYSRLQGKHYDTVVLLGPSHRVSFQGVSVGDFLAFRTPLGEIPVNRTLARNLIERNPGIHFYRPAHREEHCIEVQLPFLQTVLTDFRIVSLLFGDQSWKTCRSVADTLLDLTRDQSVLYIASTDLSHYHGYERALELDRRTIQAIVAGDADRFFRGLRRGSYELCGGAAVTTLLYMAEKMGNVESVLLQYANSGDVPLIGDRSMVVGYAAFAFLY
jgi:AmmeMemoRadiSam system protein B